MILLQLTDYNDDLMYHFFSLLDMRFIVLVWCFSRRVVVYVCHAELKDTYLGLYLPDADQGRVSNMTNIIGL